MSVVFFVGVCMSEPIDFMSHVHIASGRLAKAWHANADEREGYQGNCLYIVVYIVI